MESTTNIGHSKISECLLWVRYDVFRMTSLFKYTDYYVLNTDACNTHLNWHTAFSLLVGVETVKLKINESKKQKAEVLGQIASIQGVDSQVKPSVA